MLKTCRRLVYPTGVGLAWRITLADTVYVMSKHLLQKLLQPLAMPETAVQQELFLLGYRNLTVHVIGHTSLASIIIWIAWGVAPAWKVQLWSAYAAFIVVVLLLGRWAFHQRANMRVISEKTLRQWQWASLAMLTLPAIGWGGIGLLLVNGAHVNNVMMMTAFAGSLSYSAISNAHDLRGFVLGTVSGTIFLCTQYPRAFGQFDVQMTSMTLLYVPLLTAAAFYCNRMLIDTIRLRLTNESLAQSNAEQATRAEQASRDKSEFLAAASHDLRQPVHALMLLIEAYRQQVPEASGHPLLTSIAAAGQSISSLFNGLMELSRLEGGRDKPQLAPCDLADVIQTVAQRVLPQAQQKGLQLRVRISSRVAKLPGYGTVMTDRIMLERILGNLLTNAVRYTHHGGIVLTLRRSSTRLTNNSGFSALQLDVWDTGIGIAPADQQRIFNPYVQLANKERDRTQGLGLGLSIVQQALKLLGWPLQVHSRLGMGSCFRLQVPANQLCDSPGSTHATLVQEETMPADLTTTLTDKRILLIDDDPMVLQAMQVLLESWRIDFRCATRGDETALQLCLDGWCPDAILCDFRLPGHLNGIEMLDMLQDAQPQATGILITGELAHAVQAQAEEAGYLVLFKPLNPRVLASTLCQLLAHPIQLH